MRPVVLVEQLALLSRERNMMAQLIPTVPGIGASLGTGISKSLDTLVNAKIKQMVEAPQQEKLAQLFSYLSGAPQSQTAQQISEQAQPSVDQLSGQSQSLQPQQQNQPRQLDQQTFQKLLATLPPGLQAQAVAAYQGQQTKIAEREKESRKEAHAEQKEINARTQKYYDEVIAKGESARFANKRLDKMKGLIEKGGLPISTLYNVISSLEEVSPTSGATAGGLTGGLIGGPLGGIIGTAAGALISPVATILKGIQRQTSPNTEEFEKLSADFIKDAKGVFGSRITDADLKAFLKTVPTLAQTDQGKLKIISNIEAFNKASLAEEESLKEVIKEHKGKRPDNLQFLVQEKTRKKLDKFANEFEA